MVGCLTTIQEKKQRKYGETIKGKKVVNRHLGFGSWPDIKLTLEDNTFVSAKKLFNEMLEEMAGENEATRIMENGQKPF